MKKILHILSCLELGGTEKFIMNIFRNIDREKYQFDFYIFLPSKSILVDEIKSLGGKIYFGTTPSITRLKKFYKSLSEVLKEGQYYAVHCHVDDGNAFPLKCAKKLKVPKRVAHAHGSNFLSGSSINKLLFLLRRRIINKSATDFLACSSTAGNDLFGEKTFKKKGRIIKNGINLETYLNPPIEDVNKLKVEFKICDGNKYVLGNITRFDNNKNQSFILDVFKEFLNFYPTSILLLGGTDGGKYKEIVQKAQNLQIYDNIRFIGPRKDVHICLALIDSYIIASKHEGLSIVALEAQAAKTQCIASDSLPYETNMGMGNIKYISLNESAKTWAEEIVGSLKKRKVINNIEVKNAFKSKEFDLESAVKELEGVYE